jgi:hypothetical protein
MEMVEQLARRALRLLPADTVVPVLAGPLRGRRWIVSAAPHGGVVGHARASPAGGFVASLPPEATVWEIGANLGLCRRRAEAGLPAHRNGRARHDRRESGRLLSRRQFCTQRYNIPSPRRIALAAVSRRLAIPNRRRWPISPKESYTGTVSHLPLLRLPNLFQ